MCPITGFMRLNTGERRRSHQPLPKRLTLHIEPDCQMVSACVLITATDTLTLATTPGSVMSSLPKHCGKAEQ